MRAIFLLFPAIWLGEVQGAEPELAWVEVLRHDHWTEVDGLPQSTVTSILPTEDGRLLLGTFAALAVFDGQVVEVVEPASGEPGPTRVTALAPAADGAVWVGTEREGLWRLEDGELRMESVPGVGEQPTMFGLASVGGELWLATNQGAWVRDSRGGWRLQEAGALVDVDQDARGGAWFCGGTCCAWPKGSSSGCTRGRGITAWEAPRRRTVATWRSSRAR